MCWPSVCGLGDPGCGGTAGGTTPTTMTLTERVGALQVLPSRADGLSCGHLALPCVYLGPRLCAQEVQVAERVSALAAAAGRETPPTSAKDTAQHLLLSKPNSSAGYRMCPRRANSCRVLGLNSPLLVQSVPPSPHTVTRVRPWTPLHTRVHAHTCVHTQRTQGEWHPGLCSACPGPGSL